MKIVELAEQQRMAQTVSWGLKKASDTLMTLDGNVSAMVMLKMGMQDCAVQPVGLMWLKIH